MAQRTSQGVVDGGSALPSGTAPRRCNPDQRARSPALAKEDVLYATRPKPPAQLIRATRSNVILGTVTGIDMAGRAVLIGQRRIPYDQLVIATGARESYFGHDEWATATLGLKKIDDATTMRRRILVAFERAEDSDDEAERRQLLTFVIVGGGPTGVELAGALAELAKAALARDFRRIDPATARIVLVEAGPRLLPSFPPKLSAVAARALTRLGVELRLEAKVTRCDCEGAVLGDERIESRTLIWAAGVAASPAAAWLGIAAGRGGRVPVMSDLRPCCTDQLGWRLGPGSVEDVLLCESGTSGSLVRVAPPRRSPRWEGAAPIHNPLGCPLCHSKPMPIAVITSPSSRIG